ncbi:MAG: ABC transporter ATP-binding protein [Verrucomicrobiota bacterium]
MARQPSPILEISDLCVVRGGTQILDHLSWTIQKGEHWAILGPNGSGKSSLLSALAGYLTPTSGTFSVLGETFGNSDWRDLRTHLGIVSATVASMVPPEEPAAYTVLSGKTAQIGLWGTPKRKELQEAEALLESVEAAHLATRPWAFLSQGEKQRVLIARSLIHKPRMLVLDEPCAGLDPIAREHFLAFLSRMIERVKGPAVTLVTHHVEEIIAGFTHALLIKNGKPHAIGTLELTLRSSVLSQLFDHPLQLSKSAGRYRLKIEQDA